MAKKNLQSIDIVDIKTIKITENGKKSFVLPMDSARRWINDNCEDASFWIWNMDELLHTFLMTPKAKAKEKAKAIDSSNEVILPTENQKAEPTKVQHETDERCDSEGMPSSQEQLAQRDRIENLKKQLHKKGLKVIESICLVDNLAVFKHKHSLESQSQKAVIVNSGNDYTVVSVRHCPACKKNFVDKDSWKVIEKKYDINGISITDSNKQKEEQINKNPLLTKPADSLIPTEKKVLVIRRDLFGCINHGHPITSAIYDIPVKTRNGNFAFVPVEIQYCKKCKRFSIYEDVFYDNIYSVGSGNVLKTFVYRNHEWGMPFDSNYNFRNSESPLHQAGYNVGAKDNLSSSERQSILRFIIENYILSKHTVMSYLQYFISTLGKQPQNAIACSKWKEDFNWISSCFSAKYAGEWNGSTSWNH